MRVGWLILEESRMIVRIQTENGKNCLRTLTFSKWCAKLVSYMGNETTNP